MRALSVGFGLFFLSAVAVAQAPPPKAPARPAARAAASRPSGSLAQVMRGILFPNSNVLFDVQTSDPSIVKKSPEGTATASQAFANVYTGWQVVENAAVALEEAADVMLKPGRLCENGKPVPLAQADFVKWARDLKAVSKKALEAARTKSQEKVSDVDNDLADACANCHGKYRDVGPADSPKRCTP